MADSYFVLSLVAYVIALVFVMLFIIYYDSRRAYNHRKELITLLKEALLRCCQDSGQKQPGKGAAPGTNEAAVAKAATDAAKTYANTPHKAAADVVAKAATDAAGKAGTPIEMLITTFEKLIPSPEGMEGEGRLAMTLGFVVIIGIVMIQLLLTNAQLANTILSTPVTSANNATLTYAETTSAAQIDLIKTVVTILSGAVTAMVGFYFGAKSAAKSEASTPESSGSGKS